MAMSKARIDKMLKSARKAEVKLRQAGAVEPTREEVAQIELEKNLETERQVWRYFSGVASVKLVEAQIEALGYDDEGKKVAPGLSAYDGNGIPYTKEYVAALKNKMYIDYKQVAMGAKRQYDILITAHGLTDKDLEERYNKWVLGK